MPDPFPTSHEAELASVHYLPHDTPTEQAELIEGEVVEGEVISEEEYARLTSQRNKALERFQGYRHDLAVAARTAKTVATHQRTTTASKAAVRHVLYVPAGAVQVGKRVWEAHSNSRYERMMRQAEASGDRESLAWWEERAEQAKERRHKRAMDWLQSPLLLAKALAVAVATVVALLAGLGLVLAGAHKDIGAFLSPFHAVLEFVRWTSIAMAVAWGPLVLAVPWLVVAWFWHEGRTQATLPGWVQTATGASSESVRVDESSIAHALQHLSLSHVNAWFKKGMMLQYTVLPHREKGDVGVTAELRMPPGSTAAHVVEKKKLLAANLGRAAVEVWPSTGSDEALLRLWVADRGSLDKGAGDWPWLENNSVDAYQGIPVGTTLAGRQILAPTDGASYLVGGRPGQGKSTFTRLLVGGACLDPTAEIWVYVMASNADFDGVANRLSRYHVGESTEIMQHALQGLHDIMDEIERRGQIMRDKGARTASEAGLALLVVAFDEIHRLFQARDKKMREEAAAVAEDVARLARKYGILTIYATQSADATSIPKGVTRAVLQRVAYSVIDQEANDALLGTSAHRSGIRATELRPGTETFAGDRGKAVTTGLVADADWAMCVGYYVSGSQSAQIGQRAMQLLTDQGRTVPNQQHNPTEDRELLDDLDAVLGTDPVPAADVPALLARHAPTWAPYQRLTGKALRAQLAEHGVKVPSTGNKHPIDPVTIRNELARRATRDLDTDE